MNNNQINIPLVSVIVTTYNSAETVIETLDSIKNQNYSNIELIISDDCSTDNTVEICSDWLVNNSNVFSKSLILTSKVNTGISANLNRACEECRGEWVKAMAGDDLLIESSISEYMLFVRNNPDAHFVFSAIEPFGTDKESLLHISNRFNNNALFFDLNSMEQHKSLALIGNNLCAASFFYNRSAYNLHGIKNDERIPFLEDYPKWMNITKYEKLYYVNKVLVKYRIHGGSLSTCSTFSENFKKSNAIFYLLYLFPHKIKHKPLLAIKHYFYSKNQLSNNFMWSVPSMIFRLIDAYKKNK